jgi:hypothetical protein
LGFIAIEKVATNKQVQLSNRLTVARPLWPDLGLCSISEITDLRIECSLVGRARGAAFDIGGEAFLACDDIGVLQDSEHSRHHQITRSEAVTIEIGFVAK